MYPGRRFKVYRGMGSLARCRQGVMDVVNAEQAKIAEAAGAVAVMALKRVPADIRAAGTFGLMNTRPPWSW
ncbi:hypothetical protein [Polycladomyces abyssicola]